VLVSNQKLVSSYKSIIKKGGLNMIIKLRPSKHSDLFFLSVYEGEEMNNNTFIMSAFDTKENLTKELEYWFDKFITDQNKQFNYA
jgi:hypothetical protein